MRFFSAFEDILSNELRSFYSSSNIYLFIPDYPHIIIRGEKEDADVLGCMEMFNKKQDIGFLKTNHCIDGKKIITIISFETTMM